MGLITFAGPAGARHDEAARLTAHRLGFEFVSEARLQSLIAEEFGGKDIPNKAYPDAVASILARLATEYHLVISGAGPEFLFKDAPWMLRVNITAPDARRVGTLMIEQRVDRPTAKQTLRRLDAEQRAIRRQRFGAATPPQGYDIAFNSAALEGEQIAALVEEAVRLRGIRELGLLSPAVEAHLQFQARLKLAKHGIEAPGRAKLKTNHFMHPSEEIFANLLDFYRVAWEYEPRSFPVQWDRNGKVLEAFTPDFYLPQFDLYVELTTMKQSLVTKKNRKVKLLRQIYPEINIQVFYQKDIENLIFKYGIADRLVKA